MNLKIKYIKVLILVISYFTLILPVESILPLSTNWKKYNPGNKFSFTILISFVLTIFTLNTSFPTILYIKNETFPPSKSTDWSIFTVASVDIGLGNTFTKVFRSFPKEISPAFVRFRQKRNKKTQIILVKILTIYLFLIINTYPNIQRYTF